MGGAEHPIRGWESLSIPLEYRRRSASYQGREKAELFLIVIGGEYCSIPSGEWELSFKSNQDLEVGEYPSGGTEACFHQEGVGRREYFKGSREEYPIRLGGRMIRGGGGGTGIVTREGEKGNIQGWRGGREEGRREVSRCVIGCWDRIQSTNF
jgi:hypothetical protein